FQLPIWCMEILNLKDIKGLRNLCYRLYNMIVVATSLLTTYMYLCNKSIIFTFIYLFMFCATMENLNIHETQNTNANTKNLTPAELLDCCLVGKLLINKPIRFNALKDRLATLWKPNPTTVALDIADIWVQVHQLPYGFMNEQIGLLIDSHIGGSIKYDDTNNYSPWRKYMSLRVAINTQEPLKTGLSFQREQGQSGAIGTTANTNSSINDSWKHSLFGRVKVTCDPKTKKPTFFTGKTNMGNSVHTSEKQWAPLIFNEQDKQESESANSDHESAKQNNGPITVENVRAMNLRGRKFIHSARS
ncbi:DUF4283 domain protein, partial [Trifolium medium]|nr:DUF4283 domain protein [Trifolium medium]